MQRKIQTQPIIRTVDAVLTDFERVLLIRRAKPPFMDKLVLPGGHVERSDKNLIEACRREVREEVGLDLAAGRFEFLCRLSTPGRDPRPGRRVSTVFKVELDRSEFDMAKAGSDATQIVIVDRILHREEMGFDHFDALAKIDFYWEQMIRDDDFF
ncbi:MAG: NUDIX hydrolase [Candidatus Magasanikbacteria bacterium]|nr:NUDIX hydrolase [Candidatus Magasanikbacteria bacterium]